MKEEKKNGKWNTVLKILQPIFTIDLPLALQVVLKVKDLLQETRGKAGYFVIDKVPGRVTVTVSNLAEGGDKTTTFFIHQQPL